RPGGRGARRHQHQAVAEQVAPRGRIDAAALFQVIHPVLVGRQENLRRRALLDLAGEGGAGGVGDAHGGAGLLLVGGGRLVQRFLQAGGRSEERRVGKEASVEG